MDTSDTTLRDEEPMRDPVDEMQCPGTSGFQSFSRGMQASANVNISVK